MVRQLPNRRWIATIASFVTLSQLIVCSKLPAQVTRWDTGEEIPGTPSPRPGQTFQDLDLQFADFANMDNLTEVKFTDSNLSNADFSQSVLKDSEFSGLHFLKTDYSSAGGRPN